MDVTGAVASIPKLWRGPLLPPNLIHRRADCGQRAGEGEGTGGNNVLIVQSTIGFVGLSQQQVARAAADGTGLSAGAKLHRVYRPLGMTSTLASWTRHAVPNFTHGEDTGWAGPAISGTLASFTLSRVEPLEFGTAGTERGCLTRSASAIANRLAR